MAGLEELRETMAEDRPPDDESGGRSARAATRKVTEWVFVLCPRPRSCFGGLAVLGLILQAATGLALAFSYQPTPDHAYASVYYISHVMPYGWLLRTLHLWGSAIVIGLTGAHVVWRIARAYRERPDRAGWLVGGLAFVATAALAFTGNLLTWDQQAYWSTTAAVSLLRQLPLAGDWIARLLLDGDTVAAAALTRSHASHVILFPLVLAALLVTHARIARRQASKEGRGDELPAPDRLASVATAAVLLLCLYAALATFLPAQLGVIADPSGGPTTLKPPWYLLSLVALTRYVPDAASALLPVTLGAMLVFLPLFDRRAPDEPGMSRTVLAFGVLALAGLALLTAVGAII